VNQNRYWGELPEGKYPIRTPSAANLVRYIDNILWSINQLQQYGYSQSLERIFTGDVFAKSRIVLTASHNYCRWRRDACMDKSN
jgi:hypothetical protein